MLVFADGRTVGTIGGGCYENDAFWKAREALVTGRRRSSTTSSTTTSRRRTAWSVEDRWTSTSIRSTPTPRLFVIGAGHVGCQLGKIAPDAGFRVHVVDDREKFANTERFPEAAEVVVDTIPEWLHRTELPPIGLRRGRDARAHPRPRRHAGAGRPRLQVSRPHRQPRQGAAHLRPARRGHAAGMPGARARADRPRHRRGHSRGNRHQHHGRARRGPPRQDAIRACARDETARRRRLATSRAMPLLHPQRHHPHHERCASTSSHGERLGARRPDRRGRQVDRARRTTPSIDARGGYVLPGFIQTHVHLCQTLFRGYADDMPLLEWLKRRVWPMEAAHTPATLRASARLAAAELLLAAARRRC